jgi:hypothetical protein
LHIPLIVEMAPDRQQHDDQVHEQRLSRPDRHLIALRRLGRLTPA